MINETYSNGRLCIEVSSAGVLEDGDLKPKLRDAFTLLRYYAEEEVPYIVKLVEDVDELFKARYGGVYLIRVMLDIDGSKCLGFIVDFISDDEAVTVELELPSNETVISGCETIRKQINESLELAPNDWVDMLEEELKNIKET